MKKLIFSCFLASGLLAITSCGTSEDENKAIKDTLLEKSVTDAEDSLLNAMEQTDTLDVRSVEKQTEE